MGLSQSLMDLSTIVMLITIAVFWKIGKGPKGVRFWREVGPEFWFFAWMVVVAIGFALHFRDWSYTTERIVEFKWWVVLMAFIYAGSQVQWSSEKKYFKFWFGALILICIFGLLAQWTDWDFLKGMRHEDPGYRRLGGPYGDPMSFAHVYGIGFCLLVGSLIYQLKEKKPSIILITTILLLGLNLLYSGTRGVWFALVIAVLVGLLLSLKWKQALGIILAGVVLIGLAFGLSGNLRSRVAKTVQEVSTGESERFSIWRGHFAVFRDYPIFGIGYGQNHFVVGDYYQKLGIPDTTIRSHAHNQYIHLLAGTGVLGLFCYLMIWWFFLKQGLQLFRQTAESDPNKGLILGLVMAEVSFLMGSLTEANFERDRMRTALFFVWAMILIFKRKKDLDPTAVL